MIVSYSGFAALSAPEVGCQIYSSSLFIAVSCVSICIQQAGESVAVNECQECLVMVGIGCLSPSYHRFSAS